MTADTSVTPTGADTSETAEVFTALLLGVVAFVLSAILVWRSVPRELSPGEAMALGVPVAATSYQSVSVLADTPAPFPWMQQDVARLRPTSAFGWEGPESARRIVLANAAWMGACVALLALLVRAGTLPDWALPVMLLPAVHPAAINVLATLHGALSLQIALAAILGLLLLRPHGGPQPRAVSLLMLAGGAAALAGAVFMEPTLVVFLFLLAPIIAGGRERAAVALLAMAAGVVAYALLPKSHSLIQVVQSIVVIPPEGIAYRLKNLTIPYPRGFCEALAPVAGWPWWCLGGGVAAAACLLLARRRPDEAPVWLTVALIPAAAILVQDPLGAGWAGTLAATAAAVVAIRRWNGALWLEHLRGAIGAGLVALYAAWAYLGVFRAGEFVSPRALAQGEYNRSPGSAHAAEWVAGTFLAQGNEEAAFMALEEAIERGARPGDGLPWVRLAALARGLGDSYRARQAVEQALQIEPGLPEARAEQVLAVAEAGDGDKAALAAVTYMSAASPQDSARFRAWIQRFSVSSAAP